MVSWSNPDIPGLRSVGPPLPHSGNAERKHSFLREVFSKLCSETTLLNTSECQGDGFSTYLCTVVHLLLQRCCETNELLTQMPKLGSNAFEKKSPLRQTIELPEKGKKYLVLQKQSPKPTVVYSGTRNLKRRPLCIDFAKQTSQSQKDIMKALQNCLYRINTQGSFSQYKAILALVEVHIGINVLPHWSQLI